MSLDHSSEWSFVQFISIPGIEKSPEVRGSCRGPGIGGAAPGRAVRTARTDLTTFWTGKYWFILGKWLVYIWKIPIQN